MSKSPLWDKVCAIGFLDPALAPAPEPSAQSGKKRKKKPAPPRSAVAGPNLDYDPVHCKKCGDELYNLVSVVVKCPMGWKNLTKDGIRHKAVQVVGVKWDDTQFFCGCEYEPPRRSRNSITYKAGQRWTKGLVPDDPHRRTKNPNPIRRKRGVDA